MYKESSNARIAQPYTVGEKIVAGINISFASLPEALAKAVSLIALALIEDESELENEDSIYGLVPIILIMAAQQFFVLLHHYALGSDDIDEELKKIDENTVEEETVKQSIWRYALTFFTILSAVVDGSYGCVTGWLSPLAGQ